MMLRQLQTVESSEADLAVGLLLPLLLVDHDHGVVELVAVVFFTWQAHHILALLFLNYIISGVCAGTCIFVHGLEQVRLASHVDAAFRSQQLLHVAAVLRLRQHGGSASLVCSSAASIDHLSQTTKE